MEAVSSSSSHPNNDICISAAVSELVQQGVRLHRAHSIVTYHYLLVGAADAQRNAWGICEHDQEQVGS